MKVVAGCHGETPRPVNFSGVVRNRSSRAERTVCRFHVAITRNERSQTLETRLNQHARTKCFFCAGSSCLSLKFSFPLFARSQYMVDIVAQ